MVASVVSVERPGRSKDLRPLVDLVHETLRASLKQVHPALAEEGITPGQFWALKTVSNLEAASLSTVARYLGLTAPTVCANIDLLEAAGLVRRHRSQKDRRSVALSLTPRGRKGMRHVWSQIASAMSDAARDVSEADLAATVRVFGELVRRLDAGTGPRGGDV